MNSRGQNGSQLAWWTKAAMDCRRREAYLGVGEIMGVGRNQ